MLDGFRKVFHASDLLWQENKGGAICQENVTFTKLARVLVIIDILCELVVGQAC
jgi:hypothetical protein